MLRTSLMLMCIGLLQACSGAFFYPQREMLLTPGQVDLHYEDVDLVAADGVHLHAWYLPAQGEARGSILFLHGNAENISTHLASVYWLPARHYNVLLLDYRGYGASGGRTSLPGSLLDVETALGWLASRPEVQAQGMAVFGQSLGGALAVYAVAQTRYRDHIKTLIIDSTFSSYRRIAREALASSWLTWPLQWPLSLTVTDRYSPVPAIRDISPIPLLIIHGERDWIIPVHHAEDLFRAALEPKLLWRVPESGHIEALVHEENRQRLVEYLDRFFAR